VGGEEVELSWSEGGHRSGEPEAADLDIVAERRRDSKPKLIAALDSHGFRAPVRDPHTGDEKQAQLVPSLRLRIMPLLRALRGRRALALGRRQQCGRSRRNHQQDEHDSDQSASSHASSLGSPWHSVS
jgi:hypothetical protein